MGGRRARTRHGCSARRAGKRLALFALPMRARPALPILLAALGACAPLRSPTPPAAPSARLVPSPPPEQPNDLSDLDQTRIDAWEERLRTDPQLRQITTESLARGQRYLPGLRRILAENGLPPSLALLPAIESSFYPT